MSHPTHALTLIQPWAYAIERLGKRIENRSWVPPAWVIGKRIYIHAGAKLDRDGWHMLTGKGHVLPKQFDQRSVVCSVEVAGWVSDNGRSAGGLTAREVREVLDGEWYVRGAIGWVLRDVRAVEPRMPAKGQLGLWAFDGAQVVA